jgi:hypothetical protein
LAKDQSLSGGASWLAGGGVTGGGFISLRRVAETPFNIVLEARAS